MSSVIKTKHQQVAELCLECVRRIKLLKDGKWRELGENEKDFFPERFEEFRDFQKYEGAKGETFDSFVSWFFDKNKNHKLSELFNLVKFHSKNQNKKEDEAKKELLGEYIKSKNEKIETNDYIVEIEKSKIDELNKKLQECYEDFKNQFKFPNHTKEYSSHSKQLPSLIISNGLIPTLAFYKSKGGDRGQIFQDVSEILEKIDFKPYTNWKSNSPNKDLLEFLLETDPQTLRLTTSEVLNVATWLKRMAEIELKVED